MADSYEDILGWTDKEILENQIDQYCYFEYVEHLKKRGEEVPNKIEWEISDDHMPLGAFRAFAAGESDPYDYERTEIDYLNFQVRRAMIHSKYKERYAIAYNRTMSKTELQSFKQYCISRGFTMVYCFDDCQAIPPFVEDDFAQLKMVLELCKTLKITLIYHDIGERHDFQEFYQILKSAQKDKIDIRVLHCDLVKHHYLNHKKHRKVSPKKYGKTAQYNREKRQAKIDSNILKTWQQANRVPIKRFNNYLYLTNPKNLIYKHFISGDSLISTDPANWKKARLSYQKIADSLNNEQKYTSGGFPWTWANVRKTWFEIFKSTEFREFMLMKQQTTLKEEGYKLADETWISKYVTGEFFAE